MLLMHRYGQRSILGNYELGIFTVFSFVLSKFGTCNNIILWFHLIFGTLDIILNFLAFGINKIITFEFQFFIYLFI